MARKPLTISIEEDVLKRFKEYCENSDINVSKRIERYMKKEIGG